MVEEEEEEESTTHNNNKRRRIISDHKHFEREEEKEEDDDEDDGEGEDYDEDEDDADIIEGKVQQHHDDLKIQQTLEKDMDAMIAQRGAHLNFKAFQCDFMRRERDGFTSSLRIDVGIRRIIHHITRDQPVIPVTCLSIEDIALSPETFLSLGFALDHPSLQHLETLRLRGIRFYNNPKEKYCAMFETFWTLMKKNKHLVSLKHLDLSELALPDECIQDLVECLVFGENFPSLVKLTCQKLPDEFYDTFAKLLRIPTANLARVLEELDISSQSNVSSRVNPIILERFLTNLFKSNLQKFRCLHMSHMLLSGVELQHLTKQMVRSTHVQHLECLHYSGNGQNRLVQLRLLDAVYNTPHLRNSVKELHMNGHILCLARPKRSLQILHRLMQLPQLEVLTLGLRRSEVDEKNITDQMFTRILRMREGGPFDSSFMNWPSYQKYQRKLLFYCAVSRPNLGSSLFVFRHSPLFERYLVRLILDFI